MTDRQGLARSGARRRLRFSSDDTLIGLVRRGDSAAFETLYDRHARELLSFCRYMLRSRQDAEDAVQATFASAYKALIADERTIVLRPWLFAIARNACLSVLRQRRPHGEADHDVASHEDPIVRVEQREDLRTMLANVRELPERQRTALVLAEMHGLSHDEIGALLGVRASQVKAYVYQARSTLICERQARGADCMEIREELSAARGAALLKGRLRRHLRSCVDCSAYAERLSQQRRQFGALSPLAPVLAIKRHALETVLRKGSGVAAGAPLAGPAAQFTSGGLKVLVVKTLAVSAFVGASAGIGVDAHLLGGTPKSTHRGAPRLAIDSSRQPAGAALEAVSISPVPARSPVSDAAHAEVGGSGSPVSAGDGQGANGDRVIAAHAPAVGQDVGQGPPVGGEGARTAPRGREAHDRSEEAQGKGEAGGTEESPGKSDEAPGKTEEPRGRSEETPGKSEVAHGKSKEANGKSEEPHGKSEAPAGGGESEAARGKSEEPHG